MSEAHRDLAVPNARDINANAAAWLERRVCEDWSAQDQSELDAWLSQSPAHRVAYLRLEAVWSRTYRLAPLRGPSRDGLRKRALPILSRVVAALMLVAVMGAGIWSLSGTKEQTYATGIGGHHSIVLADGTRVELDTDTVLRARIGGMKTVWLDRGEAFFQVVHDKAHPFVVIAGKRRVTDLGTKFLVRRSSEHLEVAVMEGRVRFDTADNAAHGALLVRGDIATTTANSISIVKATPEKLAGEIGWRQGVLVFSHMTLASAAAEFNRYNARKLIVADPAVARMTIDGTFRTGNIDAFTDVAKEVLGLRIDHRGEDTVISR
jgi:transmembrane sensor